MYCHSTLDLSILIGIIPIFHIPIYGYFNVMREPPRLYIMSSNMHSCNYNAWLKSINSSRATINQSNIESQVQAHIVESTQCNYICHTFIFEITFQRKFLVNLSNGHGRYLLTHCLQTDTKLRRSSRPENKCRFMYEIRVAFEY